MKRKAAGLVLFALFVAVGIQAQTNKSSGVEQAITKLEQQWAADGKSGNYDALAPLLADNFITMDADGSLHTKSEMLTRMKGSKWEVMEVSDIKVTTFGNTAIATGAWQGKGTLANGTAVDAHERWVDTWMKGASGKWQCIASASTPTK